MSDFKLILSRRQAVFIKLTWLSFLVIYFYSTFWGASLYGVGYLSYLLQSIEINSNISYPIISYSLSFIGLYLIFKKKVSTFIRIILQDILLAIVAFHFVFQLTMDLDIGMDSFKYVHIGLILISILIIFIISLNDYVKTRIENT